MSLSSRFAAGALALGLSACAMPGAQRVVSSWDPSNPDAPAAPVRAMTALGEASPPPAPHTPPDGGTPSPTGYGCPMHPDVTAHAPGRCPRCGMKLVPQTAARPEESASRRPTRGQP